MRKFMVITVWAASLCAMEEVDILESGTRPHRIPSQDIAKKLEVIIELFGHNEDRNVQEDEFRWLLIQYLSRESKTTESNIIPHLKRRLRDSDTEIDRLIQQSDLNTLKRYVHNLITESIEDAFKEKERDFVQLKDEANAKVKRARIALAISIVGGVSAALAAFLGAYFGH